MVIGKILQHRSPEFPGWKLLVEGERTVEYTAAHLDSILKNIAAGSLSFVIAETEGTSPCRFLQICGDETLQPQTLYKVKDQMLERVSGAVP